MCSVKEGREDGLAENKEERKKERIRARRRNIARERAFYRVKEAMKSKRAPFTSETSYRLCSITVYFASLK